MKRKIRPGGKNFFLPGRIRLRNDSGGDSGGFGADRFHRVADQFFQCLLEMPHVIAQNDHVVAVGDGLVDVAGELKVLVHGDDQGIPVLLF